MRTTSKRVGYLITLLAILTAPQSARAGAKEEARKHYDRAIELIDDGQLAEAIVEFQRSYDLTKHFSVLYNIGQVYVSLAKPVEAIAAYEGYLVGGGRNIPVARRSEVEKEIARQKVRIATLVFRILPDGATVRVDGNEVGRAQPLSVGIGEHVISVVADGYQPAEVKVTVAGEDRRTIELTLTPISEKKVEPDALVAPVATPILPPAAPPSAMTAPVPNLNPTVSTVTDSPASPRTMTGMQKAGLAVGVAGIAGIATGTVCWLVGRNRHDDAVSYWNQGSNDAKAQSLQGQAQDYATAANVGVIAGGTLTILGAVLYFVGRPEAQTATPGIQARLMPAIGLGSAGVNLGGTW